MSAPYARFFTPPLHGGSFPLPRARDVVKTSVFTRPRKRDSSTTKGVTSGELGAVLYDIGRQPRFARVFFALYPIS